MFKMTRIKLYLFSILVPAFVGTALRAQSVYLRGKIIDEKGNAIVAASVRVKNSAKGMSSDASGVFTIRVTPGDSLVVSAVGFRDTTFSYPRVNSVRIVLQRVATNLGEVTVSSGTSHPGNAAEDIATQQIITGAFQEYVNSAMYSNGGYVSSNYNPAVRGGGGMSTIRINGFGPLNGINAGTMMPIVTHQEDTKGSRYLLKRFVPGVVLDKDQHVMVDSTTLLNYDKIDGQLLIAQGEGKYLEVDKEKVLAFAMKTQDNSFIFLNVPALSKVNYFQLITTGPKYRLYKSIRSKFVKANYTSNGLIESGHDYDEYVDIQTYFWVSSTGNAGVIELKKKSIREAFAAEKQKVDSFFKDHKLDDLDEAFLLSLVSYLNRP